MAVDSAVKRASVIGVAQPDSSIEEIDRHTLAGVYGGLGTTEADTTPPADVSNFNAVAGNTEIVLTWNDPGDADLNDILVTWEPGGGSQSVSTGVETYTIGSLTNGVTYTVTVYARDSVPNASGGVSDVKMPYNPASASGGSYVRASIYGAVRAARRRRN